MIIKSEYKKIQPYTTKDGSQIKELMHPKVHGNKRQSLAEASIPIGSRTLLHKHNKSEELYHIHAGNGLITLGGKEFEVTKGDTIYIPPGGYRTRFKIPARGHLEYFVAARHRTPTMTRNCWWNKNQKENNAKRSGPKN